MGGVKGSSDIFMSVPNKSYHGFYIELKVGSGRLSTDQIEFLAAQEKVGYKTAVFWDWESAKKAIEEYLIDRVSMLPCGN